MKVGGEDEEGEYAVRADGTFAVDPATGEPYEPLVQNVEISSAVSGADLNITEYQVFTDTADNLYVVYTDTTTYEAEDYVLGTPAKGTALEVYVTAKKEDTAVGKEAEGAADSEEAEYAAPSS